MESGVSGVHGLHLNPVRESRAESVTVMIQSLGMEVNTVLGIIMKYSHVSQIECCNPPFCRH